MGAGHDGAARELQRRVVARSHDVRVVDDLRLIPFKLGGFVRWTSAFRPGQLPRLRGRAVHVLDERRGGSSPVAVASPTLAAQAKRCGLTVRSFVSPR